MSNYMKTCPSSFSKAWVPHFCSPPTLNSLQGMLKVSNCRSSRFNPCRGKWQVPSWKWNSLSHVQLFVTPRSVLGILQARILELVAIPFSRGFSWLRDQTGVSQQILYHLSYQGNLANTLGKYQDAVDTFPLLLFSHEYHLSCISPSSSPWFQFLLFFPLTSALFHLTFFTRYWIGHKIRLGFSVSSYGKTQMNFFGQLNISWFFSIYLQTEY